MEDNIRKIILSEQHYKQLSEQSDGKIIAYHSSPSTITSFSLDFVGKGNDEYGPGIYFTNNKNAIFDYGPYGYEVELTLNKLLPLTKKATVSQIYKMIKNSPEFENIYENFIERWYNNEKMNKISAFNNMVKIFSDYEGAFEQFEAIWIDLYRYHSKLWCENLSNFFGYDGVIRKDFEEFGTLHYIIYNPSKIKIVNVFQKD